MMNNIFSTGGLQLSIHGSAGIYSEEKFGNREE